jgi:transglutaminase-like putative cysteine protease
MRLKISHRTEYSYDVPIVYALQRLRLVPLSDPTQKVLNWMLEIEGAREELRFVDHFGNDTRLLSFEGAPRRIEITASGEVDTIDRNGVVGQHRGFAPLWLFRRDTKLTEPGEGINALAAGFRDGGGDLERLHGLMAAIAEKIRYTPGASDPATTAEAALTQGAGVCQDHAHVFVAAARQLGFPARYVSGYLMMEGVAEQAASHAWAEAHVDNLGWVAFDVANCISPDERYVRLATGCDYRDAMPISGILLGQAEERLAVKIVVEQ